MAIDFNGSTQYGAAATSVSGALTTYSLSAWVNPDSVTGNHGIVVQRNNGSDTPFLFQLDTNGTDLRLLVRDDAAALANATKASVVSTGAWQHVFGSRSGSNVQVIHNNGAAGTATAAFGTITSTVLNIGRVPSTSPGAYFDGRIAEVGIWNVLLDAAEITALSSGYSPRLVRRSALIHYWPLITALTPGIDVIAANALTLSNTPTDGAHTRVFNRRHRRSYDFTAAAATAKPWHYYQRQLAA